MNQKKISSNIVRSSLFIIFCLCVTTLQSKPLLKNKPIESGVWMSQQVEFVQGEIAIILKPGTKVSYAHSVLVSYGLTKQRDFDKLNWGLYDAPTNVDLIERILEIRGLDFVESAEPNLVDRAYFEPNDTHYQNDLQWGLNNWGQNPPAGTSGADMSMSEAWNITRGNLAYIIGVLDSGIPLVSGALSHPDLDDSYKFVLGEDFIDVPADGVRDENGHGTHVTGIASAETDNQTGIAGVCGQGQILTVQVFDANGNGSSEAFRDGAIYAVDNGAHIINYSGGGPASDAKVQAVEYADDNDVVIIAASGNSYGSVSWPAAYSSTYSNVIAVGSSQYDDYRPSYSNFGPELNVVAPGGAHDGGYPVDAGDIYSTMPNYTVTLNGSPYYLTEDYSYMAGTSMATPHVSGVAGLILSVNYNLLPSEIRWYLEQTAKDLGATGRDDYYGYGRINAYRAVLSAKYDVQQWVTGTLSGTVSQNTYLFGNVSISNDVIVSAGKILVIEAGSNLSFASGKELQVYGTLFVDGLSDQRVQFTRSGASGSWAGITFENSSDDNNCVLKYADIEYAVTGVSCNNSSPVISYCAIDNATDHGMYLYYSNSHLKGNTVQNSGKHGMFIEYSSPTLISNTISGSGDDGVYAMASSPLFGEGSASSYGYNGFNIITDNDGVGFSAQGSTDARLGAIYVGSSCVECHTGGRNSIYDNNGDCSQCHNGAPEDIQVWANSNSNVRAEENWWGSNPPDQYGFIATESSVIDYTPWLTSDPNQAQRTLARSNDFTRSEDITTQSRSNHSRLTGLARARYQHTQRNTNAAIQGYQNFISSHPDSSESGYALRGAVQCLSSISPTRSLDYLDEIQQNHAQTDLGNLSNSLMIDVLLASGQFEEAVLFAEEQIASQTDSVDLNWDMLYRLGTIYLHEMNDVPLATQAFTDLLALPNLCPEQGVVQHSIQLLDEIENDYVPKKAGNKNSSQLPDRYVIHNPYPNPFNPSTTIRYELPSTTDLTIIIYDLLGHNIWSSEESTKAPGYYSFRWDGLNNEGRQVESGVYLISIQSPQFRDIKKAVLIR